jgi:hypothetical protein
VVTLPFWRRRIAKPTAPMPRIIIAHVAGSGTAGVGLSNAKLSTPYPPAGANDTDLMPETLKWKVAGNAEKLIDCSRLPAAPNALAVPLDALTFAKLNAFVRLLNVAVKVPKPAPEIKVPVSGAGQPPPH